VHDLDFKYAFYTQTNFTSKYQAKESI